MKKYYALLLAVFLLAGCHSTEPPETTARPLATRSDPGPITGLAWGPDGKLYAAGGLAEPLQRLDSTGAIDYAWGRELIKAKHGLRFYHGFLYVTDIGHHQVHKLNLNGKVILSLGQRGVAGDDEKHFNQPTDVAVAPNGDLYVTDGYGNSRVVCFDAGGNYKFEWGKRGAGPGEFHFPHNIVIDPAGRIYVADRQNRRLQSFDPNGKLLEIRPDAGQVFGLEIDPAGDRLFLSVTRPEWHGVVLTTLAGEVLSEFGGLGEEPGQFKVPHSLAYDPDAGILFIGEVDNRRIQTIKLPEKP